LQGKAGGNWIAYAISIAYAMWIAHAIEIAYAMWMLT
jgi:hypothetical protein